ncbi:unnamed protein product [Symbiodinium sp. CCMP2592]|nr:unnamed protein product [Symbiodinium sp. CCMP2592]
MGSYRNTAYAIHVLRVAPAITVSVNGSFNSSMYPKLADVRFSESRRLQRYLLENPAWYVPDLDMVSNSTIEVLMNSVVLAPQGPLALERKHSPVPVLSASRCSDICGNTTAGFGNDCIYEKEVDLPVPLCLGQQTSQRLNLEKCDLSVAGKSSTLLEWLQDVNVSGKFVMLGDFKKEGGSMHLPFEASVVGLYNSFRLSVPLSSLAGGVQLDIAVTQDPTSSEDLTIPLVIVSHPPAVQLHLNCSTSDCFFMPEINSEIARTEYALCGDVDAVHSVSATVDDPRFKVIPQESQEAKQCTGQGWDMSTEFRVTRVEDCAWCEYYVPWDAGYDLVVRRSISLCLKTAVDFEKPHALEKILRPTRHKGDEHNKCVDKAGLLGDAIRKTQDTQMLRVLLKMDADPSALSRGQTPLQIAAARGYLDAMEQLLNKTASTDGSLAAAASHCQVEAVEMLQTCTARSFKSFRTLQILAQITVRTQKTGAKQEAT